MILPRYRATSYYVGVIRTPTVYNKLFCVQGNNAPRGIKRAREGGGHAGIPRSGIVRSDMRMGGRVGLSWRVNAGN